MSLTELFDELEQVKDENKRLKEQIQLMHDNGLGESWVEKFNAGTYELKAKNNLLRELLAYAKEGLLIDEHLAAHIEQALKEKL